MSVDFSTKLQGDPLGKILNHPFYFVPLCFTIFIFLGCVNFTLLDFVRIDLYVMFLTEM